MHFKFNTGRLYTAEGQVIEVKLVDDTIHFYDRSRMIVGKIEWIPESVGSWTQAEVEGQVLTSYDLNQYEPTTYWEFEQA